MNARHAKLAAALCGAFLLVAGQAFSVDFGARLDNFSKLGTNDFDPWELTQQDSVSAWLRIPLSKDGNVYFATEGTAWIQFKADDLSELGDGELSGYLDLGLAKLGAIGRYGNGTIQASVGRFLVSDSTGLILSQNADGLQVAYAGQRFTLAGYAGFTGMLNGKTVSMVNDLGGSFPNSNYDKESLYPLASSYSIFGATVTFPYLFLNQTVGLESYTMFGASNGNGKNSGYDRIFLTATLNGPVVQNLFYTFSTTFSVTKKGSGVEYKDWSNMTHASLSYYLPDAKNASVSASVVYASGENGPFKPFYGFTEKNASYAYTAHKYSGVLKTGISATVKPLDNLLLSVGTDVLVDCVEKDFEYSGFQWVASARWQAFTDLVLSLAADQFIARESAQDNFEVSFGATISF